MVKVFGSSMRVPISYIDIATGGSVPYPQRYCLSASLELLPKHSPLYLC